MVEEALSKRVASPFAPAVRAEARLPFGIEAIDSAAHGGAPIGAITELVGGLCSGRTGAAQHFVSCLQAEGSVSAWVDVSDSFDPISASAAGMDLKRLLWVRGARAATNVAATNEGWVAQRVAGHTEAFAPSGGGGSPHPRSEGRNMPQAVQALLGAHGGLLDHQSRRERRMVGTPGAPNRPLSYRAPDRQEQIPTDRRPPRRGDNLAITPRCSEPLPRREPQLSTVSSQPMKPAARTTHASPQKPWQALDHALRVTDLLLTNGGFAAIVLDLGDIPAEYAWRIPLATWFRYRAACERSRTSLLLLTQHPCARSSAGLVVRMQPGVMEFDGAVMTGVRFAAEVERSRFAQQPNRIVPIRKPPQAEHPGSWKSEAVWA